MDLGNYLANAAVTPPTAPAAPSAGYPTDGNPSTGTAATVPGARWFYELQQELGELLADAGITPATATLTQVRDAIRSLGGALPHAALQFPTIATANNVLTVTPSAVGGLGGRVSLAGGDLVSLAEDLGSGLGRMRTWTVPAYVSPDLAVSSTYYLRATISAGALGFYVQKGTDSDAIPASLVGTPGAASGGGFDSTVLDILVAKIVTTLSGFTPTVTALANAATLTRRQDTALIVAATLANGASASTATVPLVINWARLPLVSVSMKGTAVTGGSFAGAADWAEGANTTIPWVISRYSIDIGNIQLVNQSGVTLTALTTYYSIAARA